MSGPTKDGFRDAALEAIKNEDMEKVIKNMIFIGDIMNLPLNGSTIVGYYKGNTKCKQDLLNYGMTYLSLYIYGTCYFPKEV